MRWTALHKRKCPHLIRLGFAEPPSHRSGRLFTAEKSEIQKGQHHEEGKEERALAGGEVCVVFGFGGGDPDRAVYGAQRALPVELLAVLSDRAGGVGRVEFHAEPEVHLPERQQRAEGHGDGAGRGTDIWSRS